MTKTEKYTAVLTMLVMFFTFFTDTLFSEQPWILLAMIFIWTSVKISEEVKAGRGYKNTSKNIIIGILVIFVIVNGNLFASEMVTERVVGVIAIVVLALCSCLIFNNKKQKLETENIL